MAHLPSLVDEMLLVTDPSSVDYALDILIEELADIGIKLNLAKCAAYIPARSSAGSGPDERIHKIPQVDGGLPALGSAHGGKHEAVLGPFAAAAEPARRRLEKSRNLAEECALPQ